MRSLVFAALILSLLGCRDNQKENAIDSSQHQREATNKDPAHEADGITEPSTSCPDSAITYEVFNQYSASDFKPEREILTDFKIDNTELIRQLEASIQTHEENWMFDVYELFERQKDSVKVLVLKGKAARVKGESPYTLEFYLYQGDTLFGDSTSPEYYYFNDRDTLKLVEQYSYDPVEGCSFSKVSKFFRRNELELEREYHFFENCWRESDRDSMIASFRENYNFFLANSVHKFNRELKFYHCKNSDDPLYIVTKTHNSELVSKSPGEKIDFAKYR
ncbi:MAG: hypothetical protein ACOYXT_09715 [Bacteroidota bacterium]